MANEIAVFNAYFAVRPVPDVHEAAEAIKQIIRGPSLCQYHHDTLH
jgi:hypothetical protein